jgi:hypothetical protein
VVGPAWRGGVGQRLPHEAKRGQADTDRQHAHLALDFGSDLQAHPMRLRDQRIQPGECRGGRSGLVLLAKKVEQPAELAERVVAGLVDRGQGTAGLGR